MAALTSVTFVVLFACSWILVLCEEPQELKETVKAGDNATLQCRGHRGADIEVIKWTRADLKPDDYILFFRDDGSKVLNESYRGRVELKDPERKDGDASVILKNVNINDTGTYECRVREENKARRRKRDAEPKLISTIELKVTETQELKVTTGEDASLLGQGHGGANITVIEWRRSDLKGDHDYVYFFRGSKSIANYQHESYRGRVELTDPKMKNGNASVILKKVKTNDTGTYECRIAAKNSGRSKRAAPELISTIKLTVTEPGGDKEGVGEKRADTDGRNKEGGGKEGNVGPMVGLTVFAVLLVAVAVVGTMIFKKHRGNTAHPGGETEPTNIRLTDPGHTAGDKEGGDKEGGDK